MEYSDEQIENILQIYNSIEEMEDEHKKREAEQYLNNTDYVVIKIQEYKMLDKCIDKDYSEVLEMREKCRNVLRKLKKEEEDANYNK